MTMNEQIKCPYCGTVAVKDTHTKHSACTCRRMHEYTFNGKQYNVLYKKDGTKEIRK